MSSQKVVKLTPKVKKGTKDEIDPNDFNYDAWPYIPDFDLLTDWLESKASAGGKVTQRAINTTGKELHKIMAKGFTVDEALENAYEWNWKGGRSEYFKNREGIDEVRSTVDRLTSRDWDSGLMQPD